MHDMQITDKQVAFYQTFGFLKLPRAFAGEIGWITAEFEQVFMDRGVVHDGTKRSCIVPFIDQREKLAALLDHPVIMNAASALLGEDFNYIAGDGNYYSGDTGWHRDGFHRVGEFLKVAFYLDPVKAESGALRVVPGSHRDEMHWETRHPAHSEKLWGIPAREVPAYAIESEPGDLLIFNHNIIHAAFGGSGWRRMFTLNLCRNCRTPEEVEDMKAFINGTDRFWLTQLHSEVMRRTAGPERMRHLQQVIDHEYELPARVAKLKETMAAPAQG